MLWRLVGLTFRIRTSSYRCFGERQNADAGWQYYIKQSRNWHKLIVQRILVHHADCERLQVLPTAKTLWCGGGAGRPQSNNSNNTHLNSLMSTSEPKPKIPTPLLPKMPTEYMYIEMWFPKTHCKTCRCTPSRSRLGGAYCQGRVVWLANN